MALQLPDLVPTKLTGGSRSIPHPEDDGEAWDTLILGGVNMPGIWSIDGVAERVIDVKKPKGQDGARFKDQGYKPADLTFMGQILKREEWGAMITTLTDIHPRKKGAANEPLTCEHPGLAYLGVTNVYVTKVFSPRVVDGILEVRISVLEWVPKPKPKKKPRDVPIGFFDPNKLNFSPEQRAAGRAASEPLALFRSTPKPSKDTPVYVGGPTDGSL